MKHIKWIWTVCILVILFGLNSVEALTVSLKPASVNMLEAPVQFKIQVLIREVDDLGGFQFDVVYDPSVVGISRTSKVIVGTFPKSTGRTVSVLGPILDDAVGNLTFGTFSFGNAKCPSGAGVLATVTFTVRKRVAGTLELKNVQITDGNGSPFDVDSVKGTRLTLGDNKPPKARAGSDKTVKEGTTVTLDGSRSSDPDDDITSYLWRQIGGPFVSLVNPSAVKTTFEAPSVGADGATLTFKLTVVDKGGLEDSDEVLVHVGSLAKITVKSPNGGEEWKAGSKNMIKWRYAGEPGTVVKIELLKDNTLDSVLAMDFPIGGDGKGSHLWSIPATQNASSDYKIRIISLEKDCEDSSDAAFSILPPSGTKPNLVGYRPAGWSDSIVLSNKKGTSSDDDPLLSTDTVYVDWAVLNNGSAPTDQKFFITLYIDDAAFASWYVNPPLDVSYYAYITDFSIGKLSPGDHSVALFADSTEVIGESNESDNVFSKDFTIIGVISPPP